MNTYIGLRRCRTVLASLRLSVTLIAGFPQAASAWTQTRITSANAQIDARGATSASARVDLALGVHVQAGWLSRFELVDLGPNLQLDEREPARFVDARGAVYVPTVHQTEQAVVLEFPRRAAALKPGGYTLFVSWTTRLPMNATGQTWTWSLPRWPNRIPQARIDILAPPGSQPVPLSGRQPDALYADDAPTERATRLSFVRAELPRTESFTVSWALRSPTTPDQAPLALAHAALERPSVSAGLGFLIALMCMLSGWLRLRSR